MSYIYSYKDPKLKESHSLIISNEIKLSQVRQPSTNKDKLNYKSGVKGIVQANALEKKEKYSIRTIIDSLPQQLKQIEVNQYIQVRELELKESQNIKFDLFAQLERVIRNEEMFSDDDEEDGEDDDNLDQNNVNNLTSKKLESTKLKNTNTNKLLSSTNQLKNTKIINKKIEKKNNKFIVPKINDIFHQFYSIQPQRNITQSQFIIIFQLIFKNIFNTDYETYNNNNIKLGNKNILLLKNIFNIIDYDKKNQIDWRHFLYIFFLFLYDGNIEQYRKDLKLLNFNSKNNIPKENIYQKNKYYKYLGITNPNDNNEKNSYLTYFLSESNGITTNYLKDNNIDEDLFYFFLIGFAIFSSTSDILNINEKIKVKDMQDLLLLPVKNSLRNEVKNNFFQEWSAYYELKFSCPEDDNNINIKKNYTDDFYFIEDYEVNVETFFDFLLTSNYFKKFFYFVNDFQLIRKKRKKNKDKDSKNKNSNAIINYSSSNSTNHSINYSISYNKLLNFYIKNYFLDNLQNIIIKKKLKYYNSSIIKKKLTNKNETIRLIYYFNKLKKIYKRKKFLKRILIKNVLRRFYATMLLKFYQWKESTIRIKYGTVIQRYIRKYQINLKYNYFYQKIFLSSVIKIQSHIRKYLVRKNYLIKKLKISNSIKTIHKFFFRYYYSKKKLRDLVLNTYSEKLFKLKQRKIDYRNKVDMIASNKIKCFFIKLVYKRRSKEKANLKLLLENYNRRLKEFHENNLIAEKIFKEKILKYYSELKEAQINKLQSNMNNKKELKKLMKLKFLNDKKERQIKFAEIEKKNEEKKQIDIENFINSWNIKIENALKIYSNFLYNCINNISTAAASTTTILPSNVLTTSPHANLPTAPTSFFAQLSSDLTPEEKEMQKKIETLASNNVKNVLREADRNHIPMEIPEAYQISAKEVIDNLLQEKKESMLKDMKAEGELIEKREAARLRLLKKNEEINRQRNKINFLIKIQNFVRCGLAYKKLTSLCYKYYKKIFDKVNFNYFYLNIKTRNILYTKPYGLGEFQDIEPDSAWELMVCRSNEVHRENEAEENRIKQELKSLQEKNPDETKDQVIETIEKKEWHGEGDPSTVVLSVETNYTQPLVYYLQPSTWTATFSPPSSLILCSQCNISLSDIYFSELALYRLSNLFNLSYSDIYLQANNHYCKFCFFNSIEYIRSIGNEFISPLEIQFQLFPGAYGLEYNIDYFLLPWQNWEYFVNNWNTPWELFQNKSEEYMIHVKKRIKELQQTHSNCEICGFSLGKIFCSGCNKIYCKKCLKKKHLYIEDEKNKVDFKSFFNDDPVDIIESNTNNDNQNLKNQVPIEFTIDMPHDFIPINSKTIVNKSVNVSDSDSKSVNSSSSSKKRKRKGKKEDKRPLTSDSLPSISSHNNSTKSAFPSSTSNVPSLPDINKKSNDSDPHYESDTNSVKSSHTIHSDSEVSQSSKSSKKKKKSKKSKK